MRLWDVLNITWQWWKPEEHRGGLYISFPIVNRFRFLAYLSFRFSFPNRSKKKTPQYVYFANISFCSFFYLSKSIAIWCSPEGNTIALASCSFNCRFIVIWLDRSKNYYNFSIFGLTHLTVSMHYWQHQDFLRFSVRIKSHSRFTSSEFSPVRKSFQCRRKIIRY